MAASSHLPICHGQNDPSLVSRNFPLKTGAEVQQVSSLSLLILSPCCVFFPLLRVSMNRVYVCDGSFSEGDGDEKRALLIIRTTPAGKIAQDPAYRRKYDPVDRGKHFLYFCLCVCVFFCFSFRIFLLCFFVFSFFPGLFTGHDPTRGSGQGGFKISRVGSGRVRTF